MEDYLTTQDVQEIVDELWTPNDLCEYFDCTIQTLINWRKNKGLPYVDIKNDKISSIRFVPGDVRKWAADNNYTMKEKQKIK